MRIYLCGLPNVGKSSCGQSLATKLSTSFVDTDREIENSHRRREGELLTCHELYRRYGAAWFRQQERVALQATERQPEAVVALGGGVFENQDNVDLVRTLGLVIYLEASVELLLPRFVDAVPATMNHEDVAGSLNTLSRRRAPCYERAAHHIIQTDGLDLSSVVERVWSFYGGE